jgi:predicted metal-dependent phosphoesterase TrpH
VIQLDSETPAFDTADRLAVEFHCHTNASADSLVTPEGLLAACRRKGIQKIVVTDHNTTAGALRAHALDPELVIVGEEIMTQDGELLAAFVTEEVPPSLPAAEAIARLKEQGAYISVSHPFDSLRKGSWKLPALQAIAPLVDAVEIFNARCMRPHFNTLAQAFAREHNLPGTAGSDAHALTEVGTARMFLPPFEDAAGLRRAMRQVKYDLRLSGPWVHFYSRYAHWKQSRS